MRYWEERAKEWSAARDKKEHAINAALMDAYQNAAGDLQKEIAAWYEKYADEAGISLADAKKRLTARERRELTRSVAAFRKLAKANKDRSQDEILTKMSAAVHINRLTSLQFQMRHILYELYAGTNDAFNNSLWGFYTDERERMTYEAQLARGKFEPVAMIDEKRISAVLKTPWAADGKNFSQRLWTNREQLIGTLQAELTRALITGADSASVAKTIAQKMNAAEYAASRLVQTEITRIITESDKDTFAEMNIDEVEIVGTLDGHTCGTCGDMDGNHVPRSEAHAGTTAPPFHPNCRCVIVPYFGDDEETGKRVMRDPETGKSKMVENMTFKEWKEKYGGGEREEGAGRKYADKSTVVSPDIKTSAYRRKFNNLGETAKVEREIFEQARDMLNHRSGTDYEDLVFIDTSTGKITAERECNMNGTVRCPRRMLEWIAARPARTVVGIHNHPHSTFPSLDDINLAIERGYKYGVIACHNGKVMKYTVTAKSVGNIVNSLLDQAQRAAYNNDTEKFRSRIEELKTEGVELEVW